MSGGLAAVSPSVLPTTCPEWCDSGPSGHVQALEEIGDPEDARIHIAPDLVGRTTVGARDMGWGLTMRADPGPDAAYFGQPIIELETHDCFNAASLHRWQLTTGAARVLARQLLHFADQGDLSS